MKQKNGDVFMVILIWSTQVQYQFNSCTKLFAFQLAVMSLEKAYMNFFVLPPTISQMIDVFFDLSTNFLHR